MPTTASGPQTAIWLGLQRVSDTLKDPALTRRASPSDDTPARSEMPWLSASEQKRLNAITASERRAAQFIAGRWLLRQLLQPLLPGQNCTITASDNGPPRLEQDAANPPLHLTLSHSGDWVCAAVAPVPVGLDIETTGRRSDTRDWRGLTQVAGSPAERTALAALSTRSEQALRFLALWTLKEAWFKQQARALDLALLPRLHTAPTVGETAHAHLWQNSDGTLALVRDAAAAHLPVRWMPPPSPGALASSLSACPAQPWQIHLL